MLQFLSQHNELVVKESINIEIFITQELRHQKLATNLLQLENKHIITWINLNFIEYIY